MDVDGQAFEANLVRVLARDLGQGAVRHAGKLGSQPHDGAPDIQGPGFVVEVKTAVHGTRDLDAALMRLARFMGGEGPELRRAILVTYLPRMGPDNAVSHWRQSLEALRPDIGARLAFIGLAPDGAAASTPDDEELTRVMSCAREALQRSSTGSYVASRSAWTPKAFDTWMVLLDAWLRREGALPIQEVVRRSGASQPIVRATLTRLQERGELHRTRNRAAELASLPRGSLGELVVLAPTFRHTRRFMDRSGRGTDVADLLRRIRRLGPDGVALGGVEAARFHMPDFDLHGTPRVDVTIPRLASLDWIERVDPGLAEAGPGDAAAVLVVHTAGRADARRVRVEGENVPYASPADVLLDLYDLRLTTQADELIRALRIKGDEHGATG
jgi:hypothetical protein